MLSWSITFLIIGLSFVRTPPEQPEPHPQDQWLGPTFARTGW